jgi:hypothetical protein
MEFVIVSKVRYDGHLFIYPAHTLRSKSGIIGTNHFLH